MDHLTPEPFLGSAAVAAGLVSPGRLRGPEFVALFRDVYVGASAELDLRVRLRAVALRAGPGAVIAGPLAAAAWQAPCPWDDVEAVVPTNRQLGRDGIRRRTDHLLATEVDDRYGVALTSPVRTAFDLARRDAPLVERVAAVDALARIGLFGATELRACLDAHRGVRGLVGARAVLPLVDRRAGSLMETRMRLVFVLRGLPRPVPQYTVRHADGRKRRIDLAWPGAKVGVEYDGEDHRSGPRHADDLDRDAGFDDLGWDLVHVTGRQVYRTPDALAARVARKLGLTA